MSNALQLQITDDHKRQYREQGYFVLETGLTQEELQGLRDCCGAAIDHVHQKMDAAGTDRLDVNIRGSRYFIGESPQYCAFMRKFLFGDTVAEICRATVGETAFLFYEQFVVKGAEIGLEFAWHQDSGYVNAEHEPYVTIWFALDDVTEENGTIYVLPYDRAGGGKVVAHVAKEGSTDKVGYHGDDPGIPVIVKAGGIAVFSSVCFHRSGPNRTEKPRRAYIAQYSSGPIPRRNGQGYCGLKIPFLREGKRVSEPLPTPDSSDWVLNFS
jgi:ectoine hydroxylase-related dioxygenase (phytanoyl-CoA dioxygenase family)